MPSGHPRKQIQNLIVAMSAAVLFTSGGAVAAAEEEVVPAPRHADGSIMISGEPGDLVGIWVPVYFVQGQGPAFNQDEVKMKPWAKGLFDARQTHDLEPHARCKASGAVRQLLTPYGVEIVDIPALQRLYIFDIGGPHTWREIYMDGRSHPVNPEPNNYGHSIGWWEGDTLVIDSVGYNTEFWFERQGLPHTESAHVIEYYTRVSQDAMKYRFVLEDPLTYDSRVEGTVNLRWSADDELFEYVCQQSNYAPDLMVNQEGEAIGRTSRIVP
jgi:hypothetical protein